MLWLTRQLLFYKWKYSQVDLTVSNNDLPLKSINHRGGRFSGINLCCKENISHITSKKSTVSKYLHLQLHGTKWLPQELWSLVAIQIQDQDQVILEANTPFRSGCANSCKCHCQWWKWDIWETWKMAKKKLIRESSIFRQCKFLMQMKGINIRHTPHSRYPERPFYSLSLGNTNIRVHPLLWVTEMQGWEIGYISIH